LKVHYDNHLEHRYRENKKILRRNNRNVDVSGIAFNENFFGYSYQTITNKQYKTDDSLIRYR